MRTPASTFRFAFATLVAASLLGCGNAVPAHQPVAASETAAPAQSPPLRATIGDAPVAFERLTHPGSQDAEKAYPSTSHVRLRSQADFDAFAKAIRMLEDGRPTVDFTRREVLAFYQPGGGNGCDEKQLMSLTDVGSELVPEFSSQNDRDPGGDKICTMVFILPGYVLYTIDRTDEPVRGVSGYTAQP